MSTYNLMIGLLPVMFLATYALGILIGYWFSQARCLDASEVRARALEDAADALFYDGDTDQPMPGYDALFARAVSEREGAS